MFYASRVGTGSRGWVCAPVLIVVAENGLPSLSHSFLHNCRGRENEQIQGVGAIQLVSRILEYLNSEKSIKAGAT